ncbi:hypothetical protein DFH01_09695 [Falsiroseomonas bella]|uniref:Serine protease n=1 Tax=Falsiroseomonas bella TaxID=2184016 RepID=A0A317FDG9_9PROT|nr:hypothetical protein [Falsiroseomonas bella]PWS37131.1 hypothetical protein DFH01_09695 [Falsiroseomonas bella]
MLDSAGSGRTATWMAGRIYEWAKEVGALADGSGSGLGGPGLATYLGVSCDAKQAQAVERLRKMKVVAVVADDDANHVGVLVKTQVSEAAIRSLPTKLGDFSIEFLGHAEAPSFPPSVAPHSAALGGSRFWTPGGRFACGSSITAAPIHSAGTMGALIRLADGRLCGLTNNHVTGACNYTEVGMHVMCPSTVDAAVNQPPPTAIGKHLRLAEIRAGDPGQLSKQRLDVAIFTINDENLVTSWQGDKQYDTPAAVVPPAAQMRLKKVGRTSGLTSGRVVGEVKTPLVFPYAAPQFKANVHFEGVWSVAGLHGDEFSTFGDSGSLVVTEDGSAAVGLILGGQAGGVTYIMPIAAVLAEFGATLVGGHNI